MDNKKTTEELKNLIITANEMNMNSPELYHTEGILEKFNINYENNVAPQGLNNNNIKKENVDENKNIKIKSEKFIIKTGSNFGTNTMLFIETTLISIGAFLRRKK